MSIGRDLRSAVFRKVMDFSQRETNVFGTPTLITRNTNDVQQIQMVIVMALNIMIMAPIMSIGGIVMAMREDVPLSSTLLVIVPLVMAVIGTIAMIVIPLFRSMQKRTDRINQVMRETLAGVRVIRAFVRTRHEEERFDEANRELTETGLQIAGVFSMMIPFLFGVMNLSTVAIVWFGGMRINSGGMEIGSLAAFLQYVMLILFSVLMAALIFIMVPRAAAAAERINAVLDLDGSICDPGTPAEVVDPKGSVSFENVEFRYPGAEDAVLSGITFTARPGQTTAIIGGTGSGKSTLINLIPRFYDVTSGRVAIDGVDVRDYALEDLWRRIGVIPQKAFLFGGTVATNLRYGDESATDDDLWHALEISQARDFVSEMSGQLQAEIDQGGANVSGGQRQRLAIARAVAKRPKIYVFDDSFSALDFKTDQRLRAALREETADATVIIVAQRVGTIMHADQIVVLDAGRIVGLGTHKDLMETCETYQEIVYSQLSREEVA
jgi:ATP-binding cassette subfamily B multidrug efflux pump